ncbi:glycosyltransferase family 39 protein [Belliella sp. DSM 107340]|uniref:Glycosyltransferase family 39 protein n=1 Tax=Belliella calami TaxID=2923436 RepID=A0ABS9ULP2_9BACT|nr:glycosyltransferase family 39 protein [Belliella calami]MCH7397533.1 glycosyltransferase family 39 protein [Belliella calami]
MKNPSFYRKLTLSLLTIIAIFKLVYFHFSNHSIFTEEAQYWLWSKHLDWNYYSKPLMIAVYNFMSTSVFGDTEFAVKFNAVLFSFLTAWVVFEFALSIYRKGKIAFWASMMLSVMPFFHLGSIFHTTDSSLYFFWILALFWIWKAWQSDKLSWWILAGFATVFGILSKNIMVLILPILALYILLTDRKRFFTKGPWIYVLVSFLSLIPIVIWNFQNDFVTFKHVGTLGGVEGEKSSFNITQSFKYIGEYVGGQLGFLSPFFIPILWVGLKKIEFKKDPRALYLVLPTLAVWLLFLVMSIFKNVNVNWPAFGMLTLPIIMAHYLDSASQTWRKYALGSSILTGFVLMILFFPTPFDAVGFKKILKPSKDPMNRLAGYRQMGERIDFLKDSLNLEKSFVFSDSYHISSEMAFYSQGNPQTFNINLGRRKNQFDLWPGISQFEKDGFAGIYITRDLEVQDAVKLGFEHFILEEKFYTIYRKDTVKTYIIAVFQDLNQIKEIETSEY